MVITRSRRLNATDVRRRQAKTDLVNDAMKSLMILPEVLVHGASIQRNMICPTYSLVQQIHVTDILDRIDLFILLI